MTELRVLSYDVDGLRAGADVVADVIRQVRPDVALLQRAPERLRWRSKRAALARKSSLLVATAHRPGGLLVVTTLAVAVHGTTYRRLSDCSDLSAAEITLRDIRWCVASTNQLLGADVPEGMATKLPAVIGNGSAMRTGGGVTVVSTEVVTGSAVVEQLLAHG